MYVFLGFGKNRFIGCEIYYSNLGGKALKYFVIFLIVFALIYFMPIKINIKTIKKNEDDVLIIRPSLLYGIINLKFEFPYLNLVIENLKPKLEYDAQLETNKSGNVLKKKEKKFSIEDFKKLYKYYLKNKEFFTLYYTFMKSKYKVRDFNLIVRFGTDDVALTAYLYGVAWIALGSLLSFASNIFNMEFEKIKIEPVFDKTIFKMEFNCIIMWKMGHIINTGIKIAWVMLKRKLAYRLQSQMAVNNK